MLKHCKPCEGNVAPIGIDDAKKQLANLNNWELSNDGKSISRFWIFKGHYQVMGFLNAVAFISQRENHHPDVTFGYNNVRISYTTHAIDGLSENDFICAEMINALGT